MANAAEKWWQSIIKEPNSFQKPTYYLGLGNWTVTNMLAAGAHERTPEKVTLVVSGATGFYNAGESMCFKMKVGRQNAIACCCMTAACTAIALLQIVLQDALHACYTSRPAVGVHSIACGCMQAG